MLTHLLSPPYDPLIAVPDFDPFSEVFDAGWMPNRGLDAIPLFGEIELTVRG
jgi:hypothetical protein